MQIRLTVIDGPHKGREFAFDAHDTFIVGRAKHAHFRLPVKDKYFSRNHFLAEVNPPRCRLMDMGSTNGTIVNGRKVDTVDLQDGDRIRAGQTVILVSISGSVEDPASEEAILPDEPTDTVLPLRSPDEPAASPPKPAAVPKPLPPARRPTVPDPVACPVCGGPLAASSLGQPPSRATILCPTCREQARGHDQPILSFTNIVARIVIAQAKERSRLKTGRDGHGPRSIPYPSPLGRSELRGG